MVRHAVVGFAALALLALVAFWPSYVARWSGVGAPVHAHAATMTAWMALLVAQAGLMRGGRRAAHLRLGRASYVLAPLAVLATLALAVHVVREAPAPIPAETLYFLYVQASLTAVFAFAWTQAIRHRATAHLHAAYMTGTALALVDPVAGRLLHYAWGIEAPLMQVLTYGVVDATLVALLLHERSRPARQRAYPTLLGAFLVAQLPTFFLHRTSGWRAFAEAIAGR
ncbi:MAG: hypothetical protein KJ018_06810 [Burkholderiales bacterium]|nr:hypothetical protein [Burkholderiales bacterium]